MEVTPVNLGPVTWAPTTSGAYAFVDTTLLNVIGYGPRNTDRILAQAGGSTATTAPAAHLCSTYPGGGLDDWFLPSMEEYGLLNYNKVVLGEWSGKYWSSTQGGTEPGGSMDNRAFLVDTDAGPLAATATLKNESHRVRPIRAF